jgi:uncharacterized protein (DUF2252 family)
MTTTTATRPTRRATGNRSARPTRTARATQTTTAERPARARRPAQAEQPARTQRPARRRARAAQPPRPAHRYQLDSSVRHLTPEERAVRGKNARAEVPLDSHARFDPPADRPDPIALLQEQAENRVPELVPVRYGRMMVSPFSYFRGAALPMASDLASTPVSGLAVQACGDAHLSNFGVFGSAERRLVFDVNDFDETQPGPWEWDVKRLAASLEVAARDNGFSQKKRRAIVTAMVARYRMAMREFADMTNLDVWYSIADLEEFRQQGASLLKARQRKAVDKGMSKARTSDSMRAVGKLTRMVDGRPRIISDPPLLVPIDQLIPEEMDRKSFESLITELITGYQRTLESDRRYLLEQYEYADMAHKVVGVGSVGTRCWIVLMLGRDTNDPLFLQVKEAQESVLGRYVGTSRFANQGQRVVAGQRLMQASSDIFLGWQRNEAGLEGRARDFYVRQLRDWKFSMDIEAMVPRGMRLYGELCGWTLARAHARSGDRIAIAAYLGGSDAFDQAIAEFAAAYADQNERDYNEMLTAVSAGRIHAEKDL